MFGLLKKKLQHCSVEGCDRTYHCKGFCKLHMMRWRRGTDLNAPIKKPIRNREKKSSPVRPKVTTAQIVKEVVVEKKVDVIVPVRVTAERKLTERLEDGSSWQLSFSRQTELYTLKTIAPYSLTHGETMQEVFTKALSALGSLWSVATPLGFVSLNAFISSIFWERRINNLFGHSIKSWIMQVIRCYHQSKY